MYAKINGIGDEFITRFINDLPKDEAKEVLEHFSNPTSVAICKALTVRIQQVLLTAASLEGDENGEFIKHVRNQTVTLSSVFQAMNDHGALYLKDEHPSQKPPESDAPDGAL